MKVFRVDNPHTKPLDFWQWLIARVNEKHPEVIFLAEAFTRPAMMHGLGKAGFQQSYTYFTWRNSTQELKAYLQEVSHESSDFFRPNFWPTTPDILPEYLQYGGRGGHKIRAAIAATAVPSWGMYAGYELVESVARTGVEEHVDSEKYEYKPRDFEAAEKAGKSLAPYITRLNQIRNTHPALAQLRNLEFHSSEDGAILVYSKHLAAEHSPNGRADTVIVVVNTDPHSVRESMVTLDLWKLGLADNSVFEVTDLITEETWSWGTRNYVRLDPQAEPVHILHVNRKK